jgi:hypothetical protein
MEDEEMLKPLRRTWILRAVAAIAVTVFALTGCASMGARPQMAYDGEMARSEAPASEPAPPMEAAKQAAGANDAQSTLPDTAAVDRKIIYTVSLDLIVKDTETAFKDVTRLAEGMGGFVAQSNIWREEEHSRGSLTVRVPAERLEEALEAFRALAVDVESQRVDSQDVTEEYVDLEARLENERRTERELQELLESRSDRGRTEDILEVHRELSRVRSQIEQLQGRMTYLDNLSSMATVHISLTPDALVQPVVVGGWRPQGTARNAIRSLLNALQWIADAGIVFFLLILPILVVVAIPIALLVLLLRFVIRRIRRRRQRRTEARSEDTPESEGS